MDMTISKWGNSLGVRIPGAVAKEAGIGLGTPVHISAIKGRIVLEPLRYNLKNLVSGISPKNQHKAIDTGAQAGHEAW
ncbi:MAG: AbrB/MazE/SpoVT family DNA-binding domain-containing protein [Pseudomonadota bacterium]|nr:AbrB/MazE/SpoVT family DNA-binding domain-containing protein [Pseudomonadota bacterium]